MIFLRPKTGYAVLGLFILLVFIDGVLRFHLSSEHFVCNVGVAFGLALPTDIIWLSTFIFLAIAMYAIGSETYVGDRLAWLAVFLGGTVNALDRMMHGCVKDYISLSRFPSFNLADMMLFLGIVFLLGTILGMIPKVKLYVG
jgi:lipoprotein signal peptidase